ncbi:uncharacterized protein TNCV_4571151 [Trichonephila clavipes]|nr:uncharacterized protein TNCV_4571151 [Trichonephila clavipes]
MFTVTLDEVLTWDGSFLLVTLATFSYVVARRQTKNSGYSFEAANRSTTHVTSVDGAFFVGGIISFDRLIPFSRVAAVAEWYRHRIVAGFVTSSSPVPLKTRRVGQRCTLNLSRAETSSRWCGVVVRRGGCQLRCRPRHFTMVQNYVVRRQKPSCS